MIERASVLEGAGMRREPGCSAVVHMNVKVTNMVTELTEKETGSQILNFFRNNREHFSYEKGRRFYVMSFKPGGSG